jgi:transcriptional regulator with XRE-family HTH domain
MKRLLASKHNFIISRASISLWERGLATPDIKSLIVLCEFFDVRPDYFFSF